MINHNWKNVIISLAFVVIFCISGFADPKDTLYQVATISALQYGLYDGAVTLGETKQHGNFGLGTLNHLDGELIVLDGKAYQIAYSGEVKEFEDAQKTPFAAVTMFEPDMTFPVASRYSYSEFTNYIDSLLPTTNIFYAIKVEGTFSYVKTRSVPRQTQKPYPRLADVVKNQSVFEFENVEGTLVIVRCPAYITGVSVPGYHIHFLTKDKKGGGHVLEFTTDKVNIAIDNTLGFEMILPNSDDFNKADIKAEDTGSVEKPKSQIRGFQKLK